VTDGASEISLRQLAATDDVARTMAAVDRLLGFLDRMLIEVALAFPEDRNEYMRHAGLLAQTSFLTVVSEMGRHMGSAEAIRGVTMEALLMILDLVLKRNACVEMVLGRHGLVATPFKLELTAVLEVGPLLARFTNRTVLEMVQFAERTVRAYEGMVELEARGPVYESPEGAWWTRCPEDMMQVTGMYVQSVKGYCRGHEKVLAKVLASVLSSLLIHVRSIGKQYDAIAAAFFDFKQKEAFARGAAAGLAQPHTSAPSISSGPAYFRSLVPGPTSALPAGALPFSDPPAWSGDQSVQYVCALVNDMGRVINTHLTALAAAHERTMEAEGLAEGVLDVQDVFYSMGKRGASLLARIVVESLNLELAWRRLFTKAWADGSVGGEVGLAAEELNQVLRRLSSWVDEAPFFPALVAGAADAFCQVYLTRLAVALDPSVKQTGFPNAPANPSDAAGEKRRCNFWGPAEISALSKDILAISSAFAVDFPDAMERSLDEIRETQQLLNIPLVSPEEDEESFAAGVDALVGMVRTHPPQLHRRLVKFTELILVAREDVDTDTTHSVISTLVLHLESHRKSNQKSGRGQPPPGSSGRADLFTLLFDDGNESDLELPPGDQVRVTSVELAGTPPRQTTPPRRTTPRAAFESFGKEVRSAFFGKEKGAPGVSDPSETSHVTLVSDSTDRLSDLSATEPPPELGGPGGPKSVYAQPAVSRRRSLSKDRMRQVVKRYAAAGAPAGWQGGGHVDDLVAGRVQGAVAQYALEVHLMEATSLPASAAHQCALSLRGADEQVTSKAQAQRRRVIWNEHFRFDKVYNIYGTDLDVAIRPAKGRTSKAAPEMDRVTIPLACLDLDQAVDDWYVLSKSGGMIRLRLLLRPHALPSA